MFWVVFAVIAAAGATGFAWGLARIAAETDSDDTAAWERRQTAA